jgi:hypothetical protein
MRKRESGREIKSASNAAFVPIINRLFNRSIVLFFYVFVFHRLVFSYLYPPRIYFQGGKKPFKHLYGLYSYILYFHHYYQ